MRLVLGRKVGDQFDPISFSHEERVQPRAEIEAGGMFLQDRSRVISTLDRLHSELFTNRSQGAHLLHQPVHVGLEFV